MENSPEKMMCEDPFDQPADATELEEQLLDELELEGDDGEAFSLDEAFDIIHAWFTENVERRLRHADP